MGYYYEQPPEEEKPPGCLDALLITRAVFAVAMLPVLAILLVMIDLGVTIWLFTVNPFLALIPLGFTAAGIWLLNRWDETRHRPPEL